MKQFIAEDSFWELFPDAQIGIVVAHGMKADNKLTEDKKKELSKLLAEANHKADQHLESNTISQNKVVSVWRDAFQKFKTKKGARCSIENLLKRVLKGNPVQSINPVVDVYNTVSLTYALPVGGEDIDSIEGNLRLRITEGGDAFKPLGEDEDAPTLEGELCYMDDAGAVCRCWNWRDGVRTALSDDSQKAFLIIESVDPSRAADLSAALEQLADMVKEYLDADIFAKEIITSKNRSMIIDDMSS
ncbi:MULTISPECIES: B3/4 domain-containing protein [unclassified Adlercreutzia]|uniref:B3/B4 domain-containing protein n=1 Tax=unclassified Adlercreutzia TaxID=2636013 RepID=UPI0013EB3108|nr:MULTISPECIES: B3/4 domain-containing protein [unclassified Adlercreutzia]